MKAKLTIIIFGLLVHFIVGASSSIADQKCLEYSNAVYSNKNQPVLSARRNSNKVSECGIVAVPLIVGGVKVQEKEFPHMAVIGYGQPGDTQLTWLCGGSLISENYILTAAHCSSAPSKATPQKVRLGITTLRSMEPSIQEINVAKVITHPDYQPPSKYNDVALILLERKVEFTPYVRPACLNTRPINVKSAIATGFGKLSYDSQMSQNRDLMKVDLDVISKADCSQFSKDFKSVMKNGITDQVICAGVLQGGKDTCQGDSGGPLQIVLATPYCMYNIIGVTSFGKFCGFQNSPAMYANVFKYINWIENIVWG